MRKYRSKLFSFIDLGGVTILSTFILLLVLVSMFTSSILAYARTTPFSPGQTVDPGTDSQPCGPLDANCFPQVSTTTVSGLGNLAALNYINNSNWLGTPLGVANGGIGLSSALPSSFLISDISGAPHWSSTTPALTLGGPVNGNLQNMTGLAFLSASSSQFTNASTTNLTAYGNVWFPGIIGSTTSCLQIDTAGFLSGIGAPCGAGNGASLSANNTWTGTQNFSNLSTTTFAGPLSFPVNLSTSVYSSSYVLSYQNPRGDSELTGNSSFSNSSVNDMGIYTVASTTGTVVVTAIKANVWSTVSSSPTVLKLFVTNSGVLFNPDQSYPAVPVYSSVISGMPSSSVSGGTMFTFPNNPITLPPGAALYAIWESSSTSSLNVTYFTGQSGSVPSRHGFLFGASNATSSLSSAGFYSSDMDLYSSPNLTQTLTTSLNSGTNQITNGGFETSPYALGSPWFVNDGTVGVNMIDSTSTVHTGSHALELVTSGSSQWFYPQDNYAFSNLQPGSYTLSFWARGNGVSSPGYSLTCPSSSWGYINNSAGGINAGATSTTWTNVVTTLYVPQNCGSLTLFLTSGWGYANSASGTASYFDDVSLNQNTYGYTSTPTDINTLLNNFPAKVVSFRDPNGVMTSTNVNDAIVEAYNHTASSSSSSGSSSSTTTAILPRIVVPSNFYAVGGDELQLFVRGIFEEQNPYVIPYVIDSTVGNSYPRYFDYTPVSGDIGTHTVTFKLLNDDYSTLVSTTTTITVVTASSSPASKKNILIVGDSLTGNTGQWPAELYRRLTQSGGTPAGNNFTNINLIGDVEVPGYPSQGFDGYGGCSYYSYTDTSNTGGHVLTTSGTFYWDQSDANSVYTDGTNKWVVLYASSTAHLIKIGGSGCSTSQTLAPSGTLTWVSGGTHNNSITYTSATNEPFSPFWDSANNKFDFTAFTSRVGASGIDAVYVLLSWNSIIGTPNMTSFSYLNQTQTFLNQLHTDYPGAIVRLIGVEVPSVNGGLGANYGAGGGAEYYGTLRTVMSNNAALQNLALSPTYSSWVQYIDLAAQFDSENNMPQSSTWVNTRNSTTENRGTNGVHPATDGYYQIADAVYRQFIADFCSH